MEGLRPLDFGGRLDIAFKIVRGNLLTLLKATLPMSLTLGVLQWIVTGSISGGLLTNSVGLPVTSPTGVVPNGATSLADLATFFVVNLVATAAAVAIAFFVVAHAYVGHRADWKQAFTMGLRRMLSVLWIQFLVFAPASLCLFVVVILVALVARVAGASAVLAGFLLGALLLVGFVWYWVSTSLALAVVMLEHLRGIDALRRSMRLVRYSFGSVWGTELMAGLAMSLAAGVIDIPLLASRLYAPHDAAVLAIVSILVSALQFSVLFPFLAAVLVVTTIDMRVRKEGFDIGLLARAMDLDPSTASFPFSPRGPQQYGPAHYQGPWQPPPGPPYPPPGYPGWGEAGYGPPGSGYPTPPYWQPSPPAPPGGPAPTGPGTAPSGDQPPVPPLPWRWPPPPSGGWSAPPPSPPRPRLSETDFPPPEAPTDDRPAPPRDGSAGTPEDNSGDKGSPPSSEE